MSSLFDKDPNAKQELPIYGRERIEAEIGHLKKKGSVRDAKARRYAMAWTIVLIAVITLVTLYCLDPLLHSYYKGNAIKAYLYIHNYGNEATAQQLVATGILNREELIVLNRRQGAFQDSYSSPDAANADVQAILDYQAGLRRLQGGDFDKLTPVNKVRYYLFVVPGIPMPTDWQILDPAVKAD